MKNESGFSLIELLIVVAIILILASLAIPNLLKAKAAANEASTASSLRVITSANFTYSSAYNQGFAGSLAQLGPVSGGCAVSSSACADLIDAVLSGVNPATATPIKAGYIFTYAAGPTGSTPTYLAPNTTFSVLSAPVSTSSGTSTFCVDATFLVRKDPSGSTTGPGPGGCLTYAGTAM